MRKKIEVYQTEDYCVFSDKLNKKISNWKASIENKNKYNNRFSFNIERTKCFHLWGEPGSGKTHYLTLWQKDKEEIRRISTLNKIQQEGIYLFDAVNESIDFSEESLKKILNQKEVFVIFSGWQKSKISSDHYINPSEEIVISKGWEKIKEYCLGEGFSIREKNLMCEIKNFEKIERAQKHSLVWKAFENIFGAGKEEIKKYYKRMVNINPFQITNDSSREFKWLLRKNIIQFNSKKCSYIFSHTNIACHLFLRNYKDEIKDLNLEEKTINVIRQDPTQFINWWLELNKRKDISRKKSELINFLKDNFILISTRNHKLIDPELKDECVLYSKLTFSDLKLLANEEKYTRIYKEYLSENINTDKPLNKEDLFAKDIAYFVYSIVSPIKGDDYSARIINSMKISGFEKKIKWLNRCQRDKMLNYNLGRYVQGYINPMFSSLTISNLTNVVFSNWDSKNKFNFYNFVKKWWDIVDESLSESFDDFLNSGKGRNSILDSSSSYSLLDKKFRTKRNSLGKEILDNGHKRVNLAMYLIFEREVPIACIENITKFRFYGEISNAFEKFMILILERYVYYFHNEPVYRDEFDYKIETLPACLEERFVQNQIEQMYTLIWEYLDENNNLLDLYWEVDKRLGKGGFNNIWIRNYYRYSIYDASAPNKAVYSAEKTYDPEGTKYVIKNGQEVKMSKNKKFSKFIISYKLDDINDNKKTLDNSFIIDLKDKDKGLKFIGYKNTYTWNILNNNSSELYKNQILDIIKKEYTK